MALVRWILGRVILLVDWLTSPRGVIRDAESQTEIERQSSQLSLYQFKACPFCVKVRRTLKRHSLPIETRDAKNDQVYRDELLAQGGKVKVPCLRIEQADGNVEWMYESSEIITYLEQRFAKTA